MLTERERERIAAMLRDIRREAFPLCVEKARLITEIYKSMDHEPEMIKQAKAFEYVLSNFRIWIDENEMIVGHGASKPWGIEIDPFVGPINVSYVKQMVEEGLVSVDEEDWSVIEEIARFWEKRNWQAKTWWMAREELRRFLKSGIWLPPIEELGEGIGGYAAAGLGLYHGLHLAVPRYETILEKGMSWLIGKVEEKIKNITYRNSKDLKRRLFYEAALIVLKAIVKFAQRFAELAELKAAKTTDEIRRKELLKIADICKRVPALPARDFHEALQSLWFIYLMCNPSPTVGLGRFDQYMYRFYRYSKEVLGVSDDQILSLLCEFRIKDMELVRLALRPVKRMQHAGMAKWHNMVIGGTDYEGKDSTNELTYMVLKAAKIVKTPHHTITLRVHDNTPMSLMLEALEVVKTGIGMPAFVGDRSYIGFLLSKGVSVEKARNYALGGCLDVALPGELRIVEANFFVVPKVLEIFLNEGVEPRSKVVIGPRPVALESLNSYVKFMAEFKRYLRFLLSLWAEAVNLQALTKREIMKHFLETLLMDVGLNQGLPFYELKMPYAINSVLLPVGMINVVDSIAAIRKLVYEDRKIDLRELKRALDNNWEGYEELRRLCLNAPKFGNDDDYVDDIASDLYGFLAHAITKFKCVLGGYHQPGGISISSMWLGGALTGATPDGRYAGEVLADGAVSPMRGRDKNGPTAVIKSAAKIDQRLFASMLLNMKFHPSALKKREDLEKLAHLIQVYFLLGGKHVQFNIIDRATLVEAQKHPERYSDLVVRVAGYSAYFVQLGKAVQDEIIERTELTL